LVDDGWKDRHPVVDARRLARVVTPLLEANDNWRAVNSRHQAHALRSEGSPYGVALIVSLTVSGALAAWMLIQTLSGGRRVGATRGRAD